jgi:uncharacterized protein
MLTVDLDRLGRDRRLAINENVDLSTAGWQADGDVRFDSLTVHLEVQKAGSDVIALGEVSGEAVLACRRCLVDVRVPLREPLSLAYQADIDEVEAERREVYVLPSRGRELDLTEAVREHVLLATPRYVVCQEACKGLCPHCGANLNEVGCHCSATEVDSRWAALRALQGEGRVRSRE